MSQKVEARSAFMWQSNQNPYSHPNIFIKFILLGFSFPVRDPSALISSTKHKKTISKGECLVKDRMF
jgi:hypothetical protein